MYGAGQKADVVADALGFAFRFQGRKRVHNVDEVMAEIMAKRLFEHLERAGFRRHEKVPDRRRSRARTRLRGLTMRAGQLIGAVLFATLCDASPAPAQEVHYFTRRAGPTAWWKRERLRAIFLNRWSSA